MSLDHSLFFSINNGWQNPVLDVLMPIATRLGEVWLIVLIVIPALYWYDRRNFYTHVALFSAALLVTGLIGRGIKIFVDRPRPLKDMADLIESHRVYVHVIGPRLRELSFPSGHTLSAFSAATFLSYQYKRYTVLFMSVALLTGLSRVYVGAHFPADVLGGMIIAISITWTLCYLTQKYYYHDKK
ncbi:MAG: phosphatase PAP2 family protein [Nitrospiria bacterium]